MVSLVAHTRWLLPYPKRLGLYLIDVGKGTPCSYKEEC
nr:MAG TPA: hypothetical protein [Bacteriophage sp.]